MICPNGYLILQITIGYKLKSIYLGLLVTVVFGCAAESHPSEDEHDNVQPEEISAHPISNANVEASSSPESVTTECHPKTCADKGFSCGWADDDCGIFHSCGGCSIDTDCKSNICTKIEVLPKVVVGSCTQLSSGNLYSCQDFFGPVTCDSSDLFMNIACSRVTSPGGCTVLCPSLAIDYTLWIYGVSESYAKSWCATMNPFKDCVYGWVSP